MIELVEGEYTIVDGRFYNQDDIERQRDVVVISEELANQNGVRVGFALYEDTAATNASKDEVIDDYNNYFSW